MCLALRPPAAGRPAACCPTVAPWWPRAQQVATRRTGDPRLTQGSSGARPTRIRTCAPLGSVSRGGKFVHVVEGLSVSGLSGACQVPNACPRFLCVPLVRFPRSCRRSAASSGHTTPVSRDAREGPGVSVPTPGTLRPPRGRSYRRPRSSMGRDGPPPQGVALRVAARGFRKAIRPDRARAVGRRLLSARKSCPLRPASASPRRDVGQWLIALALRLRGLPLRFRGLALDALRGVAAEPVARGRSAHIRR